MKKKSANKLFGFSFKNFREKITKKKSAILHMQNFMNGKLSTIEFWDLYTKDKTIKTLLLKDVNSASLKYLYNPITIEEIFNPQSLNDRYGLFDMILTYLHKHKIPYQDNNADSKLIDFIHMCQPSWLDIRDEIFWTNILSNIDSNLSKSKKKIIVKEQILSMFKYIKNPPKWVQSPEWPFNENGVPLRFIKQSTDGDLVKYLFMDEQTKKEVVVEQYY